MTVIKAENIRKSYNGEPCLRGVSLSVEAGSFVALEGESGSGKTTLLEILAGIRTPDDGRVEICGEDVFSLSPSALSRFRRTRMGVVYQYYSLVSTLTAEENIMLPLSLEKALSPETRERARGFASGLGISEALSKYPSELSGGQCQRVAIARALSYGPEVLLLDEPTGALDGASAASVLRFLSDLSSRGTTVFMITHSDRAAEAADRVIRIIDGTVA